MTIIVTCILETQDCVNKSVDSGLEMEDTVPQLILTSHASGEWGWKRYYVDVDQECKKLVAYEHSKCDYYEKAFSKYAAYCVIGRGKNKFLILRYIPTIIQSWYS